jgi:hypothetical protein
MIMEAVMVKARVEEDEAVEKAQKEAKRKEFKKQRAPELDSLR